jgi:hypothetical protein
MQEAAAPAPASVGAELAGARAGLGLSVADVAQQLKFAARQIEAMEQERFEALPSGTFARGMVRSYARLLKLDAERLVARMAARVAVPDNAAAVASTRRPIPITDSHGGNLVYAALSVAMLGVIVVVAFSGSASAQAGAHEFRAGSEAGEPQRLASVSPPLRRRDEAVGHLPPSPGRGSAAGPETGTDGRQPPPADSVNLGRDQGTGRQDAFSQLNPAGSEQASRAGRRSPHHRQRAVLRLSYEDRPIDLAPRQVEVARFTLNSQSVAPWAWPAGSPGR